MLKKIGRMKLKVADRNLQFFYAKLLVFFAYDILLESLTDQKAAVDFFITFIIISFDKIKK